ncbi:hypothetical protein NZD89_15845 [Alicyclobacillus fastidiosus]|uniref:Solute-binding protein family 5 domain-containing protein n=1 Tax=Alicyclobacillus fastidiosus TaxID=392011 RepID=A0ABY6ZAK7_9BACL|nr:hypothetical protein [Alicyclobacillus fastidiosus]WAH39872.1 hypothetical protein NZD89_15845 [Alicyclobacillus fastidiosus]GMA61139.1 hypothetical protein GCM10025859_15790 [Alicyclobacillus fastidiosus]
MNVVVTSPGKLIAQDLNKIGIQVNVQQVQYGAYMSQLSGHKFQLTIWFSQSGRTPYYLFNSLLGTNEQYNYEQFSDSTTDADLADFAKTTHQSKQMQGIYNVERTLASKLPVIPLVYGATWYEYNDSKYTGWPTADNPYETPAPGSWPAPEIVIMHLKPTK